ncbi:serine/threonine kinase [Mortierella sp. NVP41]|nr:serine/threonine kinase [Mortierella sp. NVP41]
MFYQTADIYCFRTSDTTLHLDRRQHHHIRSSTAKRFRSTYDPELAACMERWIRIVVTGQRRMQSSLAKPALNTSGPSYTVADISTTSGSLTRDRARITGPDDAYATLESFSAPITATTHTSKPLPTPSTTSGTTTTTTPKPAVSLETFFQSLDRIPIQDHELPSPFRSSFSDASKKKPMLPKSDRRAIERIWNDYLTLSTTREGIAGQLTRRDYTTLMRIVRFSNDSQLAASRILALQRDMDRSGISKNRKMFDMVAQAHLVLGSVPESTRLYREVTEMVGEGSLEHKKVVWTMVDGFAANGLEVEGIAFLDSLPAVATWDGGQDFYYALYQRLHNSSADDLFKTFGASAADVCSPRSIYAVEQLMRHPTPPRVSSVKGTLSVLRKDDQRQRLIRVFSQMVAGLLVKMDDTKMMTPLLQDLLLQRQLQEADRVLDLMLRHGVEPELESIRRYLVCANVENVADRQDLESVLEQWDAISTLRTKRIPKRSSSSDEGSGFLHMDDVRTIIGSYSSILKHCLREDDFTGAQRTAQFMAARGWSESAADEIDFRRLNSQMVNHGRSESYTDYLQVRYALGGPFEPDLHTYRRLIYAACRRSDLFSALTLFKQVRTKHPSWTLDTTLYNAIISTAATTGHIRVAEKTFGCLLEDGLKPDHYSFHGLLNGYGHSGDLEAAVLIPGQMVKHKLNPDTKTFNLIMKAYLGARSDLTTSRKLFQVMQRSGKAVPPDLVTFNQMLEGYRRVGNLVWFDAYFDRYFGRQESSSSPTSSSSAVDSSPTAAVSKPITIPGQVGREPCAAPAVSPASRLSQQQPKPKDHPRAPAEIIKPEKTDDKTLLIQLKHSLLLTSIDVSTVWELWHAIVPRLASAAAAASASVLPLTSAPRIVVVDKEGPTNKSTATTTSTTSTTTTAHPGTHVPFRRSLGGVSMPVSESDHFNFTTLSLFRTAFLSRGETKGVRRVDGLIVRMFPDHPSAQKTIARQIRPKRW